MHRCRVQRVGEKGFEEARSSGVGGGEGGRQPIAEGHEGIDLGHDAMLFGERWASFLSDLRGESPF